MKFEFPYRVCFSAHQAPLGGPLFRTREAAVACLKDFVKIPMSMENPTRIMIEDDAGQIFSFTAEGVSHVVLESWPGCVNLVAEFNEYANECRREAQARYGQHGVGFQK